MEIKTKQIISAIDPPKLTGIDHGESSMNVSWIPSEKKNPQNPGSDFYVKYRQPGMWFDYLLVVSGTLDYEIL